MDQWVWPRSLWYLLGRSHQTGHTHESVAHTAEKQQMRLSRRRTQAVPVPEAPCCPLSTWKRRMRYQACRQDQTGRRAAQSGCILALGFERIHRGFGPLTAMPSLVSSISIPARCWPPSCQLKLLFQWWDDVDFCSAKMRLHTSLRRFTVSQSLKLVFLLRVTISSTSTPKLKMSIFGDTLPCIAYSGAI